MQRIFSGRNLRFNQVYVTYTKCTFLFFLIIFHQQQPYGISLVILGSSIDRHTYRQSELHKLLSEPISLICPIYIRLCSNLLIVYSKSSSCGSSYNQNVHFVQKMTIYLGRSCSQLPIVPGHLVVVAMPKFFFYFYYIYVYLYKDRMFILFTMCDTHNSQVG